MKIKIYQVSLNACFLSSNLWVHARRATSKLFDGDERDGEWRGRRIVFCFGTLAKQQRNVMGAEGGLIIQAGISLPLCLCCHPQEK